MCELLHYFCDCELKHRVESIVAFSDKYVSKLQYNQKFRYNELMLALNMSAALTAKKTREFRSPPQEQVILWLQYIPAMLSSKEATSQGLYFFFFFESHN